MLTVKSEWFLCDYCLIKHIIKCNGKYAWKKSLALRELLAPVHIGEKMLLLKDRYYNYRSAKCIRLMAGIWIIMLREVLLLSNLEQTNITMLQLF